MFIVVANYCTSLFTENCTNVITAYNGTNPFTKPQYILLNMALGSNGGDPEKTSFPIKFEVDYVRVYQTVGTDEGSNNELATKKLKVK